MFGAPALHLALEFIKGRLNKEEVFTEKDEEEIEKEVEERLGRLSGPESQYALYKVLHLELELENVRRDIEELAHEIMLAL
jgi:hypothetical protein